MWPCQREPVWAQVVVPPVIFQKCGFNVEPIFPSNADGSEGNGFQGPVYCPCVDTALSWDSTSAPLSFTTVCFHLLNVGGRHRDAVCSTSGTAVRLFSRRTCRLPPRQLGIWECLHAHDLDVAGRESLHESLQALLDAVSCILTTWVCNACLGTSLVGCL